MFGKVERKRLFIAIDISDEVRSAIDVYAKRLMEVRADGVRWEKSEKLHLTLKFLGDTAIEKIPEIGTALAEIAAEHNAFDLIIERTGLFPTPQKARVLWIGVRSNETLNALHTDIEDRLEPMGFPKEPRRFDPHLTIARIRDARKVKPAIHQHLSSEFTPIRFAVNEIVLYESKLLDGSIYSAVKE